MGYVWCSLFSGFIAVSTVTHFASFLCHGHVYILVLFFSLFWGGGGEGGNGWRAC